ncbi:MAG: hypothetical protein ACI4TG_08910, partial [Ruminococcus sp.]
MKTTFKKAIAAVSAAAVVATSAAVFTAVPADAAGSLSIGMVEISLTDLEAANYQVTVPVSISGNDGFNAIRFGASWNASELTFAGGKPGSVLSGAMIDGIPVNSSGFAVTAGGDGMWCAY